MEQKKKSLRLRRTSRKVTVNPAKILVKNSKSQTDLLKILQEPSEKLIATIRRGLPVSVVKNLIDVSGLTEETVFKFLDVSKRTIQRKSSEKKNLSFVASDIAVQLSKLYAYGFEVFNNDKDAFRAWMNSNIPTLGGARPIDLIDTSEGRKNIQEILYRIEHSIPY